MALASASHSRSSALEKAKVIAAQFDYSDDELRKCVEKFHLQMDEGLRERTPAMCQIPTYVTRAAQGTEKGVALGVDLGGTNLRVCLVDLHGDSSFHAVHSKVLIPQGLMLAHEPAELFGFIADQIEMFLRTHCPDQLSVSEDVSTLSLGLTCSFPVYQNAVNSGILLRWAKGFDIPSVVGQDVCDLLQREITLRGLPVKVTALVNDATGTIMARAYSLPLRDTRTSIGAIFGTGTNAVYLENISNIRKPLDGQFDGSSGKMFVNIEWGSFDNELSVLPNTEYDIEINKFSLNPGDQMFEKRVSGMFLGELLRTILAKLQNDPVVQLFDGLDTNSGREPGHQIPLFTRWTVDSSILSVAEFDETGDLAFLRQKISEVLGVPSPLTRIEDAQIVKLIAHAIGKRAARLGGMALGAVVVKTEQLGSVGSLRPDEGSLGPSGKGDTTKAHLFNQQPCVVDVGVDGSVIEFYPRFEAYMREALRAVDGIGTVGEKQIRISLAKDGSSIGAAIIALVAAQQA
ncbi:MAG: hypothetical protein LQ349_005159 [Xanthoria aureola]|nr:MAG: hypothetical protein LQ349_005159 [Xanthoria aureola]